MYENELQQKLAQQDAKLDAIFTSVEKTRRYFLAVLIVSLVVFILPLVGLVFALPAFLNNYAVLLDL